MIFYSSKSKLKVYLKKIYLYGYNYYQIMSIKANNITKIYGSQRALDNVNFHISDTGVVAFLGPNGAGKSTMMRIINNLISPTEGRVEVMGMNIEGNRMQISRQMGYLPENNPLYSELYVREYLEYALRFYVKGKQLSGRIDEVIELTGLGSESHKKIQALSKGYKQRVGIAQAIIHDPKILILDEPTTGLDPNQIIEIRELIKNLGKTKIILLSTHLMQEVEAICNRVIILNKGKIVADDKTEILISSSFSDIYIVEFQAKIEIADLQRIKDIESVKHLQNTSYQLQVSRNVDIRNQIFEFAVKTNNPLLGIHKQEYKMEELFQQLTK